MSGVALQVSAPASGATLRSHQDTRASEQADSPFASMLDDSQSDPPAQDSASRQADAASHAAATQPSDRPKSGNADSGKARDRTSDRSKNDDGKAIDRSGEKTNSKTDGAAKSSDDSEKIGKSKPDGSDSDKLTDTETEADGPVAQAVQAIVQPTPQPVAAPVLIPTPLQTTAADDTKLLSIETAAGAMTLAQHAVALVAPTETQVAAQATAQTTEGGAAAKLIAAVAGETTAAGKPSKATAKTGNADKADKPADVAGADDKTGDTQLPVSVDGKAAPTAAVSKTVAPNTTEAIDVHGKVHGETENAADKTAATTDNKAGFADTLAATNASSQQGVANTAGTITAPQAAGATSALGQIVNTPAAVPISGLAVEIATYAKEGKSHFEIRLDPADLGRIDVRLDVDRQGNITSRLTVDRPDTLDLLRRDSTGLERALSDAGLKTGDNGLQFSLRDQNAGSGNTPRDNIPTNTSRIVIPSDVQAAADAPRYRGQRIGGLDIRV